MSPAFSLTTEQHLAHHNKQHQASHKRATPGMTLTLEHAVIHSRRQCVDTSHPGQGRQVPCLVQLEVELPGAPRRDEDAAWWW